MKRGAILAGGLVLLAGCGEEDPVADLRKLVERPVPPPDKGTLPELPEPVTIDRVTFRDLPRSPFGPIPSLRESQPQSDYSGPKPDPERPREPLEQFALGSLQLVGTIDFPERGWRAYVKAPDGVTYTVGTGSYMGQQYGRVEAIRPEGVVLRELVPRGEGRWEPRRRVLEIEATGG